MLSSPTLIFGLLGAALMWLALPPADIGWLAWIAPLPWLRLIAAEQLGGWRPYVTLWAVGAAYSGAAFYWLTLPHPMAAVGWVFLTAYFAFYVVLFIGLSRVAVHRLRVPLVIAAPLAWTGLELVRAYMFTGFLMGALGHTQYRWIELIQFSDLIGAYGVSFLVMFVAACLCRAVDGGPKVRVASIAGGAVAVTAAWTYGYWRTAADHSRPGPPPRIALVQGTIDTEFGVNMREVKRVTYEQYMRLSVQAAENHGPLDLIVWPESMYRRPLVLVDDGVAVPEDMPPDVAERSRELLRETAEDLLTPLLLAVDVWRFRGADTIDYHSGSVWVDYDPSRQRAEVREPFYYKMHLVVFGEYLPFGDWFPWLYKLTPLPGGLQPGEAPRSYSIRARVPLRIAPTICFETVVPHLMRRQMAELEDRGESPDVLVTQTNDGWFWGSAGLDMHLACGVFRAIELRRPLVIAANTGISAWIDADGRIVKRLGKRVEGVIVAEPAVDTRSAFYIRGGDWFAYLCLAACVLFAVAGSIHRPRP